jgi:hypothetical protein
LEGTWLIRKDCRGVNRALAAQEERGCFLDDPAGTVPATEEATPTFFERVLR